MRGTASRLYQRRRWLSSMKLRHASRSSSSSSRAAARLCGGGGGGGGDGGDDGGGVAEAEEVVVAAEEAIRRMTKASITISDTYLIVVQGARPPWAGLLSCSLSVRTYEASRSLCALFSQRMASSTRIALMSAVEGAWQCSWCGQGPMAIINIAVIDVKVESSGEELERAQTGTSHRTRHWRSREILREAAAMGADDVAKCSS